MNTSILAADARNRAWRTALQQLTIDIVVAVVLLLAPLVQDANKLDDFEWKVIAFSVGKTVVAVIFSYVMRRFIDPSRIPTPIPPVYPGEPSDEEIVEEEIDAAVPDLPDDNDLPPNPYRPEGGVA